MVEIGLDMQILLLMLLYIIAVIFVAVSYRRRKPHALRCRVCGRSLDPSYAKGDICLDCWRLGRM